MSKAQMDIWRDIQDKRKALVENMEDGDASQDAALIAQALMYVGDCVLATHHIPNTDRKYLD